jgi:hypothetical protein
MQTCSEVVYRCGKVTYNCYELREVAYHYCEFAYCCSNLPSVIVKLIHRESCLRLFVKCPQSCLWLVAKLLTSHMKLPNVVMKLLTHSLSHEVVYSLL